MKVSFVYPRFTKFLESRQDLDRDLVKAAGPTIKPLSLGAGIQPLVIDVHDAVLLAVVVGVG
jgi:hypothetical protein